MSRQGRRNWRNTVNQRGVSVLGLNGERRPGVILGGGAGPYALLYVADEFAPIRFPIRWTTVKALAYGYIDQIKIGKNNEAREALERHAKQA